MRYRYRGDMSEAENSHSEHSHSTRYGRDVQAELREPGTALRRAIPGVYEGFKALSYAAFADGVLERRTKELIALGIAVSTQCDGCIASHARGAARSGATESEVAEMLGVCIQMMGGPGTVYAARAFTAFRDFASEVVN